MSYLFSKTPTFFVLMAFAVAACYSNRIEIPANVYVGGHDGFTAVYWANGVEVRLTDGSTQAEIKSVFASGSDVYAAGYEMKIYSDGYARGVAKYWKNGLEIILPSDTVKGSYASSIYVYSGDVYVAGHDGDFPSTAKYWKNGNLNVLSNGGSTSASSIFVDGSGVYVAGYIDSYGIWWKNGIPNRLEAPIPNINGSFASSIFVDNGVAYIAGTLGAAAQIWKNGYYLGPPFRTSSQASATGIFFSGQNVYVSGWQQAQNGNLIAVCWKNQNAVPLTTTGESLANSVFFFGGDLYAAGIDAGVPVFWKNGKEEILPSSLAGNPAQGIAANSIFVTHR